MIDAWLQSLSMAIQGNIWLAPLLALLAGVLTSLTPCALSSIPLIVGYVGGGDVKPRRAFGLSLTFALGSAVTFTALGVAASLAGSLIGNATDWWYIVLGILMILMALQTWELFTFIPATNLLSKTSRRGVIGAFIAGVLGGVFSSACATPVLVVLLAVVAGEGSPAYGVLLLLLYSVGHGALAVVAGTSVGTVRSITASGGFGKWAGAIKIIMGSAILLLGFYLLYLGF